jgi:hypothetical protein
MKKDDLTLVGIYFNNEYIGDAYRFEWEKGAKNYMSILKIQGNYQAKK